MKWFRESGMWAAGLVWLVVGAGCADTVDSNAKPKYTGPMILTEEIDPVVNPLSDEPGAVEIPLEQISAFPGMQGALQIGGEQLKNSLDEFRRDWEPMLTEIYEILPQWAPKGENLQPGFAVAGTELEAVRQVHAVLVEKQPPRQSFQAGSEITLVFFSYVAGSRARLHRVDRVGNRVEIRCRFTALRSGRSIAWARDMPGMFALIPLGKLEAGEYHVNVVKSAWERKIISPDYVPETRMQKIIVQDISNLKYEPISREEARKMVCNPFSFTVEE